MHLPPMGKVGCYVTHDETSEEEHVRHSVAMHEERRYRDCPPIIGGEAAFAVILKELRRLIYAYLNLFKLIFV